MESHVTPIPLLMLKSIAHVDAAVLEDENSVSQSRAPYGCACRNET